MTAGVRIFNEVQTLEAAIAGSNLAHFYGLEFRAAIRHPSPRVVAELRDILFRGHPNLLVCIPRPAGPNVLKWSEFCRREYTELLGNQVYGSALVFRKQDAPWIDAPEYWNRVRDLWRGREAIVVGDASIADDLRRDARSVTTIPVNETLEDVDAIEREIGEPKGVVLLCMRTSATILSWRLARKCVRAHHIDGLTRP